jgi:ornithine cyclodeaminase/alanine dehydrogenase-like protein (mu-crystallin family)
VRILDETAVDALLTPQLALDAMRALFALPADAAGYGRVDLHHPVGWLRALPGFLGPLGVFGLKTIHRTDGVGMRYTIYVHDLESGVLRGLVDGLAVTNLRTGAVTATAADLLAVPEVDVAALVGTGPVAEGQLLLLDLVRPAREVRVYARTPASRRRFIERMAGRVTSTLIEAESLDAAINAAQMVTLATKATEPILTGTHLAPGIHVNSVGPASRDRVEVDPGTFASFDRVVCDSVELVTHEAGDAFEAVNGGLFDPGTADDLADLVAGRVPGRRSPDETTLFKSVGTGLQDLIVAARLLEASESAGIGRVVDDFVSVKPLPR